MPRLLVRKAQDTVSQAQNPKSHDQKPETKVGWNKDAHPATDGEIKQKQKLANAWWMYADLSFPTDWGRGLQTYRTGHTHVFL